MVGECLAGGVPQAECINQGREALPPEPSYYWDGGAGMLRSGHLIQSHLLNKVKIAPTNQVALPWQVHAHTIIDECLLVSAAVGQVAGHHPEIMPTPL
jgi:hypothetical protein